MTRILLLAALLLVTGDDKRAGRRGNAHYEAGRYEEAAAAYREGLTALPDRDPGPVSSGLMNNLGAALYRQGDFEGALTAFTGGAALSDSPGDLARASYNAGNASFRKDDLDGALAHYRRTLLRDPSDAAARFNYEYVKRKKQEQQENQQQQDQQQQDQEQDQEQQQQEQQQQQDQQQQDQQQQQEPQNPEDLSRQEAERLLEALENEEEQLLRQVQKMKSRPRRVEKDW